MDRRLFLRRASLIAAGIVAADQLDLLDRLSWSRTMFPSGTIVSAPGASITDADLSALLKGVYEGMRGQIVPMITPLYGSLRQSAPVSLFDPPQKRVLQWSGSNHYFDVVTDRRCPPNTAYLA